VQPRTSIFGGWKLDHDDSDDPRKKMQEARRGSDRGYGNNRPIGGGGYPGGGGYGGHRMGSQGESDEERQKMQQLLNPSERLTLAEAQRTWKSTSSTIRNTRARFSPTGASCKRPRTRAIRKSPPTGTARASSPTRKALVAAK
jgi:hypothetical protein